MDKDRKYFYSDGTDQHGPLTLKELLDLDIRRETLIWHEGLEDWKQASELPELREKLRFIPPEIKDPSDQEIENVPKDTPEKSSPQSPEQPPKTWLVESILVTLFCCMPLGIIGIIYAAQVESKFYTGNTVAAEQKSRSAGRWTKLGFWIGLSALLIYFFYIFFFGMSGFDYRSL